MIASLPRTGSTLLCRALWDTALAGSPKEYLNPMQVRDWEARLGPDRLTRALHRSMRGAWVGAAGRGRWSDARLRGYLRRVRLRRSTPNGWFGLKLHWHHHHRWFARPAREPEAFLGPIRWVWLTRRDHTAQAVSWVRALQTGRWASWQPPGGRARYAPRAIARALRWIEAGEAGWRAWFGARGITPLALSYEALLQDWTGSLGRVFDALQLEAQPPPQGLGQLADERSRAWIERFCAEQGR